MKAALPSVFLSLIWILFIASSCSKDDDVEEIKSNQDFPRITSFQPTSGGVSTIVEIRGENFEYKDTDNIVKFDGITAKVLKSSEWGVLNVEVPAGVSKGIISLETSMGVFEVESNFALELHSISSILRISRYGIDSQIAEVSGPGEELQITGKNFSRYAEDNIVRINGLECQVKSVLDDGGYFNSDIN